MKISRYFELDEFTRSQTAARHGIDNTPPAQVVENLAALCQFVLDPLREMLNRPIQITSGYRAPKVNQLVGGATTSQHVLGCAADFVVPGMTPQQVFEFLRWTDLPIDQAISEFGQWTHVSFSKDRQRGEFLIARHTPHGAQYEHVARKASSIAAPSKLPPIANELYAPNATPLPEVTWADASPPTSLPSAPADSVEAEPPRPQMPDYLQEAIKQACGYTARHALTWLGGALISWGAFKPEQVASLLTGREAWLAGALFTLAGLAWAAINSGRLLSMIRTALHLSPQKATGEPVSIAEVRSVTKSGGVS